MRLRTRIALVVAGSVAAGVLVISGVLLYSARAQSRSSLDETLLDRASVVQLLGGLPTPRRGGREVGGGPQDRFGRFVPDDVLLQIIDDQGRIEEANVDPLPIAGKDLEVADGKRSRHFSDVTVDGVRLRVLTVPLQGDTAAMLARPLTEIDNSLTGLRNVVIVVAVLGVAGAGGLGFLVAGGAIRPVRRLTAAASAVAETQKLDQPIDVRRDDELGELATSFNAMLEALEVSRQQQHRLVTDASHELRTPLTSLRTNVELLQRAPQLDVVERSQIMDDVLFELDELTALVSELVELATDRHELGEPEIVDMAVLVDAVVQRHRRRTDTEVVATLEPCQVRVVPALVERAASNLIDNALKWSPAGGRVEVTLRDGELRVRDRGPGIPESEWDAVFERFYRAEAARAAPGSGLGLSIVRHVAESFGGEAMVVPTDGPGATVVFGLPTV